MMTGQHVSLKRKCHPATERVNLCQGLLVLLGQPKEQKKLDPAAKITNSSKSLVEFCGYILKSEIHAAPSL
jgi:hypothetical protein